MAKTDTILLVRKAQSGDRAAWDTLLERYYDLWLGKYHGDLGKTVHKLYDTQDLVQSAVVDAMKDLPQLENEAAFFSWVTSIIRHKVGLKRRRLAREEAQGSQGTLSDLPDDDTGPVSRVGELDDYLRTLEKILELFPEHPEPMAAVTMMFLDDCSARDMVERFGKSKSSVYRWIEQGIELLKGQLAP